MASNASILKQRTLSAIVFVIIMLTGLIWNNWSFFTLFLVIQLGCLFEYQKLLALIYPSYQNISSVHKWGLLFIKKTKKHSYRCRIGKKYLAVVS